MELSEKVIDAFEKAYKNDEYMAFIKKEFPKIKNLFPPIENIARHWFYAGVIWYLEDKHKEVQHGKIKS